MMRTLITLIVVVILCVVVLGFYRGWFSVSSFRHDTGDKVDINLTVDPNKAKEDAGKVKEKTTELGDRAKDKVMSGDK